jgi:selenide,water dikinase
MPAINLPRRREVMKRSIALGHCICDPRLGCPCPTLKNDDRCPCAGETAPEPPADALVRLTQSVKAAGCGAKIGKAQLASLLGGLPVIDDPRVLIGSAAGDDAAVLRLEGTSRDLVQTVDVLSPPVDDPYSYGRIAAANALSDIWAMGGRAECALSVVGWPMHDLPPSALAEVLRGGAEAMREAGVPVVGGQSVNAAEPFAGYSVTGTVEPDQAIRNQGARPGDVLVLSKALGGGFLGFAQQIGLLAPEHLAAWTAQMAAFNRAAGEAMLRHGAHAGTDVTGFALLGHAIEIAMRSPCDLVIDFDRLPIHPGVQDLARREVWPGALERNREAVAAERLDLAGLTPAQVAVLFCPETSGGILAFLPADAVFGYRADCATAGVATSVIGEVTEGSGRIRVTTTTAAEWSPLAIPKSKAPAPTAAKLAAMEKAGGWKLEAGSVAVQDFARTNDPAPRLAPPASSLQPPALTTETPCCAQPPVPAATPAPLPATGALPPAAAAAAFTAYMQAVTAPGALDARTKKLIALALSVAGRCEPCVGINAEGAQKAGADQAQIAEAVALGIAFGGAPTAMFYNGLRK